MLPVNHPKHKLPKKISSVVSSLSRRHLLIFVIVFALIGSVVLYISLANPNPNLTSDLNGDNKVDITDLSILLTNYGTTNAAADINGSGTVDVIDLSTLLSHWGDVYVAGYNSVVLADNPVAFWAMNNPSGAEADLTGHGNNGTYKSGVPTLTTMPSGDQAVDFNGSSQYMTVPSSPSFSIPTTKQLTWEAWIRPDTLQFPNDSGYGYIDWMGKCQNYSPSCEWESRMYSTTNLENRCNRLSAYVFNPSAGLGSGADWQPTCGLLQAGQWLHVVGEYQTITTPSGCNSAYPGTIDIWVNGVKWNFASHTPTGCMSQFNITPTAVNSPLNIGTMALETWFKGAVGKVAIYDKLLTQTQINNHFAAMTGSQPSGSCGNTCTIPIPTGDNSGQMFITTAELLSKPTTGTGWTYLKSRADLAWPVPNLGDQFSTTQTDVLAAALMYARDPVTYAAYKAKVVTQLTQVCGTEANGTQLLNLARTLYGYVVAADMVKMPYSTVCNSATNETWQDFLGRIRDYKITGGGSSLWTTLSDCSKNTSGNWGAYCLSSHLAVSYALNDTVGINKDIEIFKRILGDTTSTAITFSPTQGYNYNGDGATWDMSPTLKRGINPCTTAGNTDCSSPDARSGALIEDALRGAEGTNSPYGISFDAWQSGTNSDTGLATNYDPSQGYQEEAMDGIFSTAQLLRAHGINMFSTQGNAMQRAFNHWKIHSPSHWGSAYWKYLPYFINYYYGTNNAVSGESLTPYRHMGYGTWLFTGTPLP